MGDWFRARCLFYCGGCNRVALLAVVLLVLWGCCLLSVIANGLCCGFVSLVVWILFCVWCFGFSFAAALGLFGIAGGFVLGVLYFGLFGVLCLVV